MLYLIVDDHARARSFLRDMLATPDSKFIEAADGREACDAYVAHEPDWVVMDIDMPNMDGITATRQILSDQPKAKIVIITQHSSNSIRAAALDAGAHAFLLKENLIQLPDLLESA